MWSFAFEKDFCLYSFKERRERRYDKKKGVMKDRGMVKQIVNCLRNGNSHRTEMQGNAVLCNTRLIGLICVTHYSKLLPK